MEIRIGVGVEAEVEALQGPDPAVAAPNIKEAKIIGN